MLLCPSYVAVSTLQGNIPPGWQPASYLVELEAGPVYHNITKWFIMYLGRSYIAFSAGKDIHPLGGRLRRTWLNLQLEKDFLSEPK